MQVMKPLMKIIASGILALLGSQVALADCQVSLSQHDVNYGQVKRGSIVDTTKEWNTLSERQLQLNAYCPEPEKMALFFGGKAGEQQVFAFGNNSRLVMVASNAILDGNAVQLNQTANHGTFTLAGQTSDKQLVRSGQGLVPVSGGQVLAGQQFSVTLTVKPALNHSELSVKDKQKLGSTILIEVETE